AGGKAQDDEMPFHPALRIADDGFAKAGEGNRLDCQPRLLAHLARHGLRERLADLDHASGQGEQAMGWRTRAAHHKYLAIAHDGGAHGEVGTLGIGSRVRHGGGLSKSMTEKLTLGEVVRRQPCAGWFLGRGKRGGAQVGGRYMGLSSPGADRRPCGYPEQPNFPPRYNVAPTQPVPIVRIVEGQRQFALVRWGLIPPWVKDPRAFALLINARGESVNDRAAFRYAMRRRRCLVPADGFYAWKDEGGRKRPYCVRPRQGGPIAFAGLWETWIGPNGEEMETAIIITTAAKGELARLHERTPVIVPPDAFDLWLDCGK